MLRQCASFAKLLKKKKSTIEIALFFTCDPVGIQTQDLQNRNLTLYSAKLRDPPFCILLLREKATAKVQNKFQ